MTISMETPVGGLDSKYVLSLTLEKTAREVSGAKTIGGYLRALLDTLMEEGNNFNGKRPLGTSGWQADLHLPLVQAGIVDGTIDEYGYLEYCDGDACDTIIANAIAYIFREYK